MLRFITLLTLLLYLSSCGSKQSQQDTRESSRLNTLPPIRYAECFSWQQQDGYILLTIEKPWADAGNYKPRYAFVRKGDPIPTEVPDDVWIVEFPVSSVVCLSTTHLPLFDILKQAEVISGFAGSKYISSPYLKKRLEDGLITEVGSENGINIEKIADLQPDLVIAYASSGGNESIEKMRRLGLSVLINAEYLETSPLGKAEWMKIAGLLTDQIALADSIFTQITSNYEHLVALTQTQTNKPSVFSNVPYGNTWYVPGGKSFAAHIMQDAGASYFWADTETNGSIPLSLESVFERIQEADYWLNPGSYTDLKSIAISDNRFQYLKAWKNGQVFSNDKRQVPDGGNDYWETGVVRPDWLLADLIHILHPQLLPEHELYFYRKLD